MDKKEKISLLDLKNWINQFSDDQLKKSPMALAGEDGETIFFKTSEFTENMYQTDEGLMTEQDLKDGDVNPVLYKIKFVKGDPFLFT